MDIQKNVFSSSKKTNKSVAKLLFYVVLACACVFQLVSLFFVFQSSTCCRHTVMLSGLVRAAVTQLFTIQRLFCLCGESGVKWQLDTRNTRNRTLGAKRSFHVFVLPFSNAQQVPKTFEKVLMPWYA